MRSMSAGTGGICQVDEEVVTRDEPDNLEKNDDAEILEDNWPNGDESDGPGGGSTGGCPVGCGSGGIGIDSATDFFGKIDATDLANHPKANCSYQKLDRTKTMQNVVSKFAGEDTDFDLNIVVRNINGFGELDSAPGIDTFYMRLDEEGILQRKSIETAVLFLHEAIHAEMRRYLRGATDESTLPGFPGNFTHDWKLFVQELYGGNSEAAEHEATAVKYRDVIVEGLKEYDRGALTTDEYRALAWHGLSNTDYYKNVLTDNEKQSIVDNRESALYKSTDSCN